MSENILLLCGAGYVSGKEVMALTLATGLIRRGKEVHVISSTWNDGEFIARLDHERVPHSQLPFGFMSATLQWKYIRMTVEQISRWPDLLLGYRRVLKLNNPSRVIHTNWHHILLAWPLLRKDRDVLWMHEVMPDLKRFRVLFAALAPRVRGFIAVSHAVARSLKRVGVPSDKIAMIHNGIPDLCSTAQRATPSAENVRIGIVGQVGVWKGHSDLIAAFSILAPNHPSMTLEIFGAERGSYQDLLRSRIAELGLTNRVVWRGFFRDRAAIYGAIDVCVVPSLSEEPLGMTAIEAGLCEVPVVATRRGGLPEIVEHGATGLLVSPNAPHELAAAIEQLVNSPIERAEMGARARTRMRALFSEERFLAEFSRLVLADHESSSDD